MFFNKIQLYPCLVHVPNFWFGVNCLLLRPRYISFHFFENKCHQLLQKCFIVLKHKHLLHKFKVQYSSSSPRPHPLFFSSPSLLSIYLFIYIYIYRSIYYIYIYIYILYISVCLSIYLSLLMHSISIRQKCANMCLVCWIICIRAGNRSPTYSFI